MDTSKNHPSGKHSLTVVDAKITNKGGQERLLLILESANPQFCNCNQVFRSWPLNGTSHLRFYEALGAKFSRENIKSIVGKKAAVLLSSGKNGYVNITRLLGEEA